MATTPLVTQALLLNDETFKSRVSMGILQIASDIQNEPADTPNHENRVGLAGLAFNNPIVTQQKMYNYIIIQPAIKSGAGNSSTIPDQAVLDAISAVWNQAAEEFYTPPPAPYVPPELPAPPALQAAPVPPLPETKSTPQ